MFIITRIHIYKERSIFNNNGSKLCLKNGIYDYETKKFTSHNPYMYYTTKLNVAYNPDAKCPCIDNLLEEILEGEDRLVVLEASAYCFVPSYRIENFFFFYGSGNQGKGTVLHILESMLGEDNYTSSSFQELSTNDNYCRARLFGKAANICGDIPKKSVKETDFIKKITGGDSVTVREIRKKAFEMFNTAKLIFAGNESPEIHDDSDGFYRRIIQIPFTKKIEKVDVHYKDKVVSEEEKSGFFNILMPILTELLKRGSFSHTKTIEERRALMDFNADPIRSFLSECTAATPYNKETKKDLYREYVAWCEIYDQQPLAEKVFSKRLSDKKQPYKLRDTVYKKRGYKNERCWDNLELFTNYRKDTISGEIKISSIPSELGITV